MSHVVEINDVHELEQYRLVWQALLPKTPNVSFFHTLDWLELYWRHFGEQQKLRALVVHAEGRPVGILPLCVSAERSRLGMVRKLTYPVPAWATFFGPVGPNPTATLLVAMRHIRETARDWDMIDLPSVDVTGADGGRTERALRAQGFSTVRQAWSTSAVVRLDSSWDEYVEERSDAWREKLEVSRRQLAARGSVRFLRYRPEGAAYDDGDPRWDLYSACEEISRRSGATFEDETAGRFLRDMHETAAARGMVDLCLLSIAQQPVAYLYGYQVEGRLLMVRAGVVPSLAGSDADHVLLADALQESFARGDRCYEIPSSIAERYGDFTTGVQTSQRLLHYRALDVRAQAVRLERWRRQRKRRHLDLGADLDLGAVAVGSFPASHTPGLTPAARPVVPAARLYG